MKTALLTAIVALAFVSCEKPSSEVESKLSELEKKAAQAVERQQQLEAELEEQKILAERDAIERERTLIEQERIAMEERQDAANATAANELQRRQAELMERERKISEVQGDLDNREQHITGMESRLSERELDLAGREPLDALPPIQKQYVSGPTGDYNNFYEPLGAYGSWFQTSDYGYVYQPSVVRDSAWRPYTRGRWAFTNQGWTWVSNEPFGWACYHYGRWALLRNVGWVWVPGSEWAPAWVTWRESPGHIGWAPLPPETLGWRGHSWDSSVESRFVIDTGWFSFISYNHFGNDIYRHCLPVSQNIVIYHNTTNITHYVVRDRRVFVGGPRYRNVCDRIGRDFPIHRLRLDQSPDFGRGGRRLNSQFRGDELQVVAPRMDADWNRALRPSRVSRDLGNVVVNRSKELPEDVRRQYRERRIEEDTKAQMLVTNAGGSVPFEKERRSRLEKGREEVAKIETTRRIDRNRVETNRGTESSDQPPVTDTTALPKDQKKRPIDKGNIPPVGETPAVPNPGVPAITDTKLPVVPNPEVPAITDTKLPVVPNPEVPTITDTQTPTISNPEVPAITDTNPPSVPNPKAPRVPKTAKDSTVPRSPTNEKDEISGGETKSNRLPRGVVPSVPSIGDNLDVNKSNEPKTVPLQRNLNDNPNGPQLPPSRDSDLKSDADKKAARELLKQQDAVREEQLRSERALKLQQEESARQQQLEVQRQLEAQQSKLNEQLELKERNREQKEQGDKLRDLQDKQELARKEQEERLRAQQEQREQARNQDDKLREQQAQQELARKQQEEAQDRLKEQSRVQQEQQEKMRDQQEQLRAQQEQQEKMRAQQEQSRAQQEQQEKLRAQQEQQDRVRAQQAQQEQQARARQQQEEAQQRMQAQQEQLRAQQEQQERMRAQQEQQERARQQQEEAQRRMQAQQEQLRAQQEQQERMRAQQEQQERARQQQEEAQRRAEQQQIERARQQQEQQERARQSQGQ